MPRRVPVSGEGVTQKVLAELLNVDARQVRNLEREGLPATTKKGTGEKRYPWPQALHWYIRFKQEEMVRRNRAPKARAAAARAAQLEAQAELVEMELRERRGELVSNDFLDQRVTALFAATRGVMLSFAGKWAPDLVGCLSAVEVRERLEVAIADGLAHIERAVTTAAEDDEEDQEPDDRASDSHVA